LNNTLELPARVNILTGVSPASSATEHSKKITVECGSPYGEEEVLALHELSRHMMKDPLLRKNPAWVVLANWLNKKNSLRIKSKAKIVTALQPLGLVFHVSPGNVETMGWYSAALGFLTGNTNVIRVSERVLTPEFKQALRILFELSQSIPILGQRLLFIQYAHDQVINEYLSKIARARMLWGGDATVDYFLSLPTHQEESASSDGDAEELKNTCVDMCFRDRSSGAILSLAQLEALQIRSDDEEQSAFFKKIAADVFPFGQRACSSPRKIVFLNEEKFPEDRVGQLLEWFHKHLSQQATNYTDVDEKSLDYSGVVKFSQLCEDVLSIDEKLLSSDFYFDGHLSLVPWNAIGIKESCRMGYLYYSVHFELVEALKALGANIQTLVQFGFSADGIQQVLSKIVSHRIDRIVAPGTALDFSEIWDGYNIPAMLVRSKWQDK